MIDNKPPQFVFSLVSRKEALFNSKRVITFQFQPVDDPKLPCQHKGGKFTIHLTPAQTEELEARLARPLQAGAKYILTINSLLGNEGK